MRVDNLAATFAAQILGSHVLRSRLATVGPYHASGNSTLPQAKCLAQKSPDQHTGAVFGLLTAPGVPSKELALLEEVSLTNFRNRKRFTCQFHSQYRRTHAVFSVLSQLQNISYKMGENNRTPEWSQPK